MAGLVNRKADTMNFVNGTKTFFLNEARSIKNTVTLQSRTIFVPTTELITQLISSDRYKQI